MTSRCGLLIIVIFTNIVGSSFDGLSMQVVPLACFAQQKKYCEQVRASNCFFILFYTWFDIYIVVIWNVVKKSLVERLLCVDSAFITKANQRQWRKEKRQPVNVTLFVIISLFFFFSDGLRPKICTRVVGCKFPFLCTSLSSSKGNVYILILWFRLSRV